MGNTATLKKISEHLNISISTVSRALKDHPDVAPETKKRVRELAELMDYEPNAFAVNLRKRHSNVFAVIVPAISNFLYQSFIQAVEEEARQQGFTVLILQSMDDPEQEKENLRLCCHNQVAGIFVCLTSQTTQFDAFRKVEDLDIPLIFFDTVPPAETFNKVCLADEEAGQLAAKKLLHSGKKQVLALMGNPGLSITERRLKGFREACSTLAPTLPLEFRYVGSQQEAREATATYFAQPQPPTAIFSMSDEIMCGVLKALNDLHLRMPGDVSLITISNGLLPGLFSPEISYVETSGYALGKLCFTRMQEMLEGKKFIRENMLSCTYHEGGSL